MNENEVTIRNCDGLITLKDNDLPEIISSQINMISALENKVKACDASAKKAMEYVSSKMTRYEEKGKWIFRHRSGNTKDIIEDTQEAIDNLATAQQITVEALKQSFEFQRKLADVSKYLFNLGCLNITLNRISVRTIEEKLSGASKEEISDLARQEMINVVKQLKEQEDILKRQEELKSKVRSNFDRLNAKDTLDAEHTKQIEYLKLQMFEKDRIITEQSQRIDELYGYMKSRYGELESLTKAIEKKQDKEVHSMKRPLRYKNGWGIEENLVQEGADTGYQEIVNCSNGSVSMLKRSVQVNSLNMVAIPCSNYEMSATVVTQKLYNEVMKVKKLRKNYYLNGDNFPAVDVNWYDAIVFCNKLSEKDGKILVYAVDGVKDVSKWKISKSRREIIGKITQDANANGYRLPTVKEWRKAARGGQDYIYSGSNDIDEVAWYRGAESNCGLHEVGKKKPNSNGLYDMSGNVYEWCWDANCNDGSRVILGGGFTSRSYDCEIDKGGFFEPYCDKDNLGFRVVCSVSN